MQMVVFVRNQTLNKKREHMAMTFKVAIRLLYDEYCSHFPTCLQTTYSNLSQLFLARLTGDFSIHEQKPKVCQKITWSTRRTVQAAAVANLIAQYLVMYRSTILESTASFTAGTPAYKHHTVLSCQLHGASFQCYLYYINTLLKL